MTILTEIIGFAAAVVGTSIMLPQIIKSVKTKSLDDVSRGMLILYFLNCLLWLIYGALIVAWPVILCNAMAFLISIVQISLKIKYSKK